LSLIPGFNAGSLVCVAVLCAGGQAFAQYYGPTSCTESDVETNLHFYQAPNDMHVVAVEYRNVGDQTCVLDPLEPLAPEDAEGAKDARFYAPVELKKGDVVHSSFRWSTANPNSAIHCRPLESLPVLAPPLRNPLQFVGAQILLPPACSRLRQTDYLPGLFVPDWGTSDAAAKPPPSAPVIIPDRQTYYAHEPIVLHVKLTDRPASDATCPYLVEKVQDSQGNTRLTQVDCVPGFPGAIPRTGPANEFNIRVGGNLSWGVDGLGENTFTIYQVAYPTPYGELRLVPSNSIAVKIAPSPHVCLPNDLAPALHFYRTPDKMAIVALDYTNTSDSACKLKPVWVKNHVTQDSRTVVINPGETVHTSYRWSAQNDSVAENCQSSSSFVAYQPSPEVSILSPTLVPQPPRPCTGSMEDEYQPGPFVPDWTTAKVKSAPMPQSPVLIAPKTTYDEGEIIELRLLTGAPAEPSEKCPVLFESIRDDQGYRLREFNMGAASTPNGCKPYNPWPWRGKWLGPADEFPIEVEPNGVSGLDATGKRTVVVSELAGTAPDGELRLVSSNAVTLNVVDPATIQRNWGETVEGMRADLTLDKLSYPLGEDISLHLGFEDVSAAGPVYGRRFERWRCAFEPEIDYTVTVENEDGSKPQYFELPPLTTDAVISPCATPPPTSLTQGKIVPIEDTLMHLGLLPRQPGTYRITVSWSAYKNSGSDTDEAAPASTTTVEQNPFVTVNSVPLMLRIAPQETVQ
jgi:hypothetical protein